jgi:hypothetical protein
MNQCMTVSTASAFAREHDDNWAEGRQERPIPTLIPAELVHSMEDPQGFGQG